MDLNKNLQSQILTAPVSKLIEQPSNLFRYIPKDKLPHVQRMKEQNLTRMQKELEIETDKKGQLLDTLAKLENSLQQANSDIQIREIELSQTKQARDKSIGTKYLLLNQHEEGVPLTHYNSVKSSWDDMRLKLQEMDGQLEQSTKDLQTANTQFKSLETTINLRDKEIRNMQLEVNKLQKQTNALSRSTELKKHVRPSSVRREAPKLEANKIERYNPSISLNFFNNDTASQSANEAAVLHTWGSESTGCRTGRSSNY